MFHFLVPVPPHPIPKAFSGPICFEFPTNVLLDLTVVDEYHPTRRSESSMASRWCSMFQGNKGSDVFDPSHWGLPTEAVADLANRLQRLWSRFRDWFNTKTRDTG